MSSWDLSLTGRKDRRLTIKMYDYEGILRREVRILADGSITYKEWDRKEIELTMGWKDILEPIEKL